MPETPSFLLQGNRNLMEIPSGFFNRINTLKVLDISGQVLSLPPSIRLLETFVPYIWIVANQKIFPYLEDSKAGNS